MFRGTRTGSFEGASQSCENVDYILTEVSFRLLYEGQTSFDDLYELLKQLGFSYAGNVDQLLSAADGSVLQADALFVRDTASIPKHTISA